MKRANGGLFPTSGNPLGAATVTLALAIATQIGGLRDAALARHIPPAVPVLRGLRLFMDAGRRAPAPVKIAREAMRANPRLSAIDALVLATRAYDAGRARGLAPWFLPATLLQESAFDVDAVSPAGAIGIAQFTVPTARAYGVDDPWDPRAAIDGAARLLADYVDAYRGRNADPYALALAAYDAGPAAVQRYGGVPPYAETVEYISDVRERWSRMAGR